MGEDQAFSLENLGKCITCCINKKCFSCPAYDNIVSIQRGRQLNTYEVPTP
jgi:hypothetical protein